MSIAIIWQWMASVGVVVAIADDLKIDLVPPPIVYKFSAKTSKQLKKFFEKIGKVNKVMVIKKGQIWKRNEEDRYYLITQHEGSEYYLKHIGGSDNLGHLWRNKTRMTQVYTHIKPVVCLKCGTARARLTPAGKHHAKGLKCWSCK